MALSASLFLRQSQSLVMTPQLMQSIQLLQMTHLELSQFIAQEVEKNPLLEFSSGDGESAGTEPETGDFTNADGADGAGEAPSASFSTESLTADWYESENTGAADRLNREMDANFDGGPGEEAAPARADAPELLGQWKSMPGGDGGEGFDLDDFMASRVTLREHLLQQVPFALTAAADRLTADVLIDHADEAGYLQADPGEIAARLGRGPGEVEAVLSVLQGFDPPGVLARSLAECLAIQLRQKDRLDPAMSALLAHLDLLARRDFTALKRICGVDEEDLVDMLAEIRKLNPKPGADFEAGVSEAILPDVVVRASADGGWAVELNPDTLPRVLVNHAYYHAVSRNKPKAGEDQSFLSECLQNASWLTRSLDQRARTILKVASEIVRQQDAFLVHGVDHLRPLNLKTVAEAIGMHESTVSRVTSNKYMLTPRGLFELKYFFTVSIGATEGGEAHSAESVRHRIRSLIAGESVEAVLSDDDIVAALKTGGVDIARRTVAKYREAMNIPSSVQRRREKRAQIKAGRG